MDFSLIDLLAPGDIGASLVSDRLASDIAVSGTGLCGRGIS